MLANDLAETLERLSYVDARIDSIEAAINRFNAESFSVAVEAGGQGFNRYIARQMGRMPISISIEVGVAANEMRACLDALVCKLALRNGKHPDRHTAFVITESEFEYDHRDNRRRLSLLREDDIRSIREFRPYISGRDGTTSNGLLWALHRIDIKRKHLDLLTCEMASGFYAENGYVGAMVMEGGRGEGHVASCLVSEDTTAQIKFAASVLLDEPELPGARSVVKFLRRAAAEVRHIVSSFAAG